MALGRISSEPLSPLINVWEDECRMFTRKLKKTHPNLEFNLIPHEGFIYVDFLIVAEEHRQKGLGKNFMRDLTALADEVNCPLALTPDTSFGSSDEARLENLYAQFGFIKNIGKARDFSTNHTMIRTKKRQ